jgi:hypothetical protein
MIGPSSSADDLIAHLENTLRSAEKISAMAASASSQTRRSASPIPRSDNRPRCQEDHARARLLWDSDIREARLLAL